MMSCWKQMEVLQGNGGMDPDRNKTLFVLSDDDLLLLMNVSTLSKLIDRSRTEGESISTFR